MLSGGDWLEPAGHRVGEVSVHHGNGPFAVIGRPGVSNANGLGRGTWPRAEQEKYAEEHPGSHKSAARGATIEARLKIPVREPGRSSSEPQREFILFICFYCMTRLESRALHSHSAF